MKIKNIDISEKDLVKITDFNNREYVGFACKPYWLARLFKYTIALSIGKKERFGDSITREPMPFKEKQIKKISIIIGLNKYSEEI